MCCPIASAPPPGLIRVSVAPQDMRVKVRETESALEDERSSVRRRMNRG